MTHISIIICSYRGNEEYLIPCIKGVEAQDLQPSEVLIVVDTDSEAHDIGKLLSNLKNFTLQVISSRKKGLSAARNAGIAASTGEIIVFLDDDAVPEPGWLRALTDPFLDPAVMVTGGPVKPRYAGRPLPDNLAWMVGCTVTRRLPVRPIGCNMAFRREVFQVIGLFDDGYGRIRNNQAAGEETLLLLRIMRDFPHSRIMMVPTAEVTHYIPAYRTRLPFLIRRAWQEGLSKGRISRSLPVTTEKVYLWEYLKYPRPLSLLVLAVTGLGFLRGRFI